MDKGKSRKLSENHQQQYTYNKKLLDNMSTLLEYIESSRQDLLSGTKTLLSAYKHEFEDGNSMQEEIAKLNQGNLELENARNKVENDLLRFREAYNRELIKNDELDEKLKINESILKQIYARIEQLSVLTAEQKQFLIGLSNKDNLDNITDDKGELDSLISPKSTFNSSRISDSNSNAETVPSNLRRISKRLNSSTLTYTNQVDSNNIRRQTTTNFLTASVNSRMSGRTKQEHNFEEVTQSKSFFNSCSVCRGFIIPLIKYYHCLNCDIKIDKKCYNKSDTFPCHTGNKKFIKLQELPVQKESHISELIVKCCQQIEQRGLDTPELYQLFKEKQAVKILQRYFIENNVDNLKLHKLNVHIVCSIVMQTFKILDESLITRKLWQDFALLISHKSSKDCDELLQLSIDKLDTLNRQTLAFFILHLKKISTKNFGSNLNNQTLASIFGPIIAKNDNNDQSLIDRRKSSSKSLKLFNIQSQIMQLLLKISSERWTEILANRATTAAVNVTRRKTANFRDVLEADKKRVSFYEKLNNSMY